MHSLTTLHQLRSNAIELYYSKCEEINKLRMRKSGSPSWVTIRQHEAAKLKQIVDGLTTVELPNLIRAQFYQDIDQQLLSMMKQYPELKGHIIIIGPDKTDSFPYFSRISLNIPMSFYKS